MADDREVLLEEYRQAMESQRDNTRIAYSWVGSIFLVLASGLFFFGVASTRSAVFVPAMVLGLGLSVVWLGLTEVFAGYTGDRFQRALEIEKELGARLVTQGLEKFQSAGWLRRRLMQARTYVALFVFLYWLAWGVALALRF